MSELTTWCPSLDGSSYDIRSVHGGSYGFANKHSDGRFRYHPMTKIGWLAPDLMREVADGIDRLNASLDAEIAAHKQTVAQKKSIIKAQLKDLRDKVVQEWARKNIHPGCMVKMSGCRDGKGIRLVLEYEQRDTYWDILECRQMLNKGMGYKQGQITTHYANKLSKILVEGKWESVSKLAKIGQNLGEPE